MFGKPHTPKTQVCQIGAPLWAAQTTAPKNSAERLECVSFDSPPVIQKRESCGSLQLRD